jgi:PPOX class probable F420-dependent enzyme
MRLDPDACWERLGPSGHGVLGTVHPGRGVDAVPVVFVVVDHQLVIPIDTVKAKSGTRLQRLVNLDADPRGVLLVDHYDDDWSQLWWVRAHGRAAEAAAGPHLEQLGDTFPAYRAGGAVTSVLVLAVDELTGWTAGPEPA